MADTTSTPAEQQTLFGDAPKRRRLHLPRTRISETWWPTPEQLAKLRGRWPEIDYDTEIPKFVNWHLARGSLMADWIAALRTWSTNHRRFAQEKERTKAAQAAKTISGPDNPADL
jgi:hypothetical protein